VHKVMERLANPGKAYFVSNFLCEACLPLFSTEF